MTDLRTAAQQALKILELEGWGYPSPKTAEAITALKAALVEDAMQKFTDVNQELEAALAEPCPCGDRPAAQCPGEWEPGCDLGNNPKYAKRVEMTPKELAASIKRGEKWKVAEPVQENKDA